MEIKLNHISKIFSDRKGNETRAVDDLNVTIESGKLIGLLGPSGCGKSTTLFMIAGLHDLTAGSIYFGDDDVSRVPPEKRGIGLVFQNYALYPHMTVRQNIMFPMENLKFPKDEMEEKTEEVSKLVGINNLLDRKPSQLSGGQQQRVAIARALVKNPKVLLLDEPLSNLDARLRLQMREEIKRIQRKTGTTTVFVTHDQEEAMSICDEIVLMEYGVEQQRGIPQDIYDDPKNLFVAKFLGTPPINLFKANIKNNKVCIGTDEILDAKNLKKITKTWQEVKENHPVVSEENSKLTMNICGSSRNQEILEALMEEFSKQAGNFKYNFTMKGSKDAFAKVQGVKKAKASKKIDKDIEGFVDKRMHLGVTTRALDDNTERGAVRFMRQFLTQAFVPVVHPDNPLEEVSFSQLKLIFSKKYKKWSKLSEELGELSQEKILTFLPDKKSASRQYPFKKLDVGRREKGILSLIPLFNEKTFKTEEELISKLKETKNAISFIAYESLKDSGLKELKIDGQSATEESILNYTYPFATTGVLIAGSNPKHKIDQLAVAFLDFVKTIDGESIIRKQTNLYPIKDIVVGIRPEGYEVSPKGNFNIKYNYYESIGRDLSLICSHPAALSDTFRIILQDVKVASELKESKVKMNIKPDKIYVFDEETGERIL